jgi:hypothetical protein
MVRWYDNRDNRPDDQPHKRARSVSTLLSSSYPDVDRTCNNWHSFFTHLVTMVRCGVGILWTSQACNFDARPSSFRHLWQGRKIICMSKIYNEHYMRALTLARKCVGWLFPRPPGCLYCYHSSQLGSTLQSLPSRGRGQEAERHCPSSASWSVMHSRVLLQPAPSLIS